MTTKKPTYKIHWSTEDGEYVATIEGQPSISYLDFSPVLALQGLIYTLNHPETT